MEHTKCFNLFVLEVQSVSLLQVILLVLGFPLLSQAEANSPTALALSTLCIIIRSTFRAIELFDGFTGKLANDEVLYMILEPPMITIAVVALTIFHPGIGFQGAWDGTKRAYKGGVADMESSSSYEADAANDRAIFAESGTAEADDETRTVGGATLQGDEGWEMQSLSKAG